MKFYQTEIYGRIPENAPKVTWEVTETDDKARDGTAIMKRLVGRIGDKADAPKMNMTIFLPAKATEPVPMMLAISFGFGAGRGPAPRPAAGATGGAAARPADQANAPNQAGGAAVTALPVRPANDAETVGEALRRGWGYATLTYTDIQPDRANTWSQGVIGQTLKEGQMQPAPDEWGTISAWAWGISRAIDYLETDKAVNAKQIAITGTSRLGKTVLWAGAQDPRVAAVFSVVSGEMGAALIRRDWGETLDDMAQNFGYQFAGNLQKWAGRWNDLPVDQHMLIARMRAAAGVCEWRHFRSMVRPQRRVSGDDRRRASLQTVGRNRPGRDRSSAVGSPHHDRRPRVPLPQRWPHGRARRLDGIPRLRRTAF